MATGNYSLARLKRLLFEKGLRSVRSKKELGKSAMQRILTNPIYYGDFIWSGKYYAGKHTPIIDKALFDKVQEVMGLTGKPRQTKRDFAYTGLMTCANCGCSITAEEHRKKSGRVYIYYRCTNGRGLCDKLVYLPENKLELQFQQAVERIKLPHDIVAMTRVALLESSKGEQEVQATALAKLNSRYARLQMLIGGAYEDKLLGTIDVELWEQKTSEWKKEQADIQRNIAALKSADTSYMLEGIRLLELSERAAELFPKMKPDDKRKMLKTILLNPSLNGGTIEYKYKNPFSFFEKSFENEKWRERRDLNPRPLA